MKNHISLFIFAIALLSGPVSANDLSMTAVKDTLASIPGEHNYIYVRTPLGEDEEKNYDEITFYDGLGRELDFAQSYGADRAGATRPGRRRARATPDGALICRSILL